LLHERVHEALACVHGMLLKDQSLMPGRAVHADRKIFILGIGKESVRAKVSPRFPKHESGTRRCPIIHCALPKRRVTVHSGDMGYTMGPFARRAECPGRRVNPWMSV
jgi:hypothetical protein